MIHDTTRSNLGSFMKDYESYGGLAMNWNLFGSSGHIQRPAGGVLANYDKCLPRLHKEHKAVKVIANTEYLAAIGMDPHHVRYTSPLVFTVTEKGQKVTGGFTSYVSVDRIALYHYVLKSENEYKRKMRRGSAAGNHKGLAYFNNLDAISTDTCTRGKELAQLCCSQLFHGRHQGSEAEQQGDAEDDI